LIPVNGRDDPLVDALVVVVDEIEDESHRLGVEHAPP
jgi:hypothetical protein